MLEIHWFSRYPWPEEVITDRGKEFMAEARDMLKDECGVVQKWITTRNPQANSIVERAHKTVGTMVNAAQIRDVEDLDDRLKWSGILAAVGFAMRATVHTTTTATPTQLVFNRDAIHNVGFQADWKYIKERKQRLIVQNNNKENAKRIPHEYQVGDRVMMLQHKPRKFGKDQCTGPFAITQVHDNGTARLQQTTTRGGVVSQTWNIRNLHPCKD